MAASGDLKGHILGFRHVQILLLFLGLIVGCIIRLNASIAVVAITNAKTSNPDFPEYHWNEKQKSYIISSIYWGFIVSQSLGSWMCRQFGAKVIIGISILAPSILSLATPTFIHLGGWQIYCVIRVTQGLFQGMFFPSHFEHIAKWSPVEERTRLGAIVQSGLVIGSILAMMIAGFVARSSLGWPGIYYVAGVLGLVWWVFWQILSDNSPSNSRLISSVEKNYILSSQKILSGEQKTKIPIPWKSILTSVPCLSLLIVHICFYWIYSTLLAEMPLYMHGILKLDIRSNALFSGLPYLGSFLMSYVYIIVMEFIVKKKIMSLFAFRKTINSISMWIPAVILLCIGFLDETQKSLVIVLLVITVSLSSGQTIGSSLNAIDLSPNHVLIIMGIVCTSISFVAMVTPIFAGIVVDDETNRTQWQKVFGIAAVMAFLGNLQYLFFGSNVTQPWNDANFLSKSTTDCEKQRNIRTIHMNTTENSN